MLINQSLSSCKIIDAKVGDTHGYFVSTDDQAIAVINLLFPSHMCGFYSRCKIGEDSLESNAGTLWF